MIEDNVDGIAIIIGLGTFVVLGLLVAVVYEFTAISLELAACGVLLSLVLGVGAGATWKDNFFKKRSKRR